MKTHAKYVIAAFAAMAGIQNLPAQHYIPSERLPITNNDILAPDPDGPNLPTDRPNSAGEEASTVAGGEGNVAEDYASTVGGGANNYVNARFATIGGGERGWATAWGATVSGGRYNQANGRSATVAGGQKNTADGDFAAVPGGANNLAGGVCSYAAGNGAQATNNNAFVWSDGAAPTISTDSNQFVARATGGVYFYSAADGTGALLSAGSGSWSAMSDRNAKKGFAPIDSQAVLDKVAALPMTTWAYKTEPGVRHVGPMAQDFHSAFGVGEDDRHISEVDANGVALAAIQGLNQKLKDNDAEIKALKATVEQLQKMIQEMAPPTATAAARPVE